MNSIISSQVLPAIHQDLLLLLFCLLLVLLSKLGLIIMQMKSRKVNSIISSQVLPAIHLEDPAVVVVVVVVDDDADEK